MLPVEPPAVTLDERAQAADQVIGLEVRAAEACHVEQQTGCGRRVAGNHEGNLGRREAGRAQPPGPVLTVLDVGVHRALPARGVQPLAAVLHGQQPELGVAVVPDLGYVGVVMTQEDRGAAVQGGDGQADLEEPVPVRALLGYRLAVD